MKAIDYRLAFDVTTSSDRWPSTIWPLIVLSAVGLALIITPQRVVDRLPGRWPRGPLGKAFSITFFLFMAIITLVATRGHYTQLKNLRSLENAGRLQLVEGCLQSFHPMPEGGHDEERIRVAGKDFSYTDFDDSSPAFNNAESHGGPIHADSAVRIWHSDNEIIRLEVGDHACPFAPDLSAKRTALGRS